ncbi:hypothetical protein Ancab_007584 [Ancistrocladus abbreviatus]
MSLDCVKFVKAVSPNSKNLSWDPCVLEMNKHKLLREDILLAMASNQKVQQFLNEFMDLLSEYGSAETIKDQVTKPAVAASLAGQVDSMLLAKDQMHSATPATKQKGSISQQRKYNLTHAKRKVHALHKRKVINARLY